MISRQMITSYNGIYPHVRTLRIILFSIKNVIVVHSVFVIYRIV